MTAQHNTLRYITLHYTISYHIIVYIIIIYYNKWRYIYIYIYVKAAYTKLERMLLHIKREINTTHSHYVKEIIELWRHLGGCVPIDKGS